MSESKTPPPSLLTAAQIQASAEIGLGHILNPGGSAIYMRTLSRATGMARAHVNLGRLPPGKQAFVYHSHLATEEWLYILSGRGRTEIEGRTHEVGAGDFMGFPAPSVAHVMWNPYEEDLVYLMGGEDMSRDIGVFPRHGKYMVTLAEKSFLVDAAATRPVTLEEFLLPGSPAAEPQESGAPKAP